MYGLWWERKGAVFAAHEYNESAYTICFFIFFWNA